MLKLNVLNPLLSGFKTVVSTVDTIRSNTNKWSNKNDGGETKLNYSSLPQDIYILLYVISTLCNLCNQCFSGQWLMIIYQFTVTEQKWYDLICVRLETELSTDWRSVLWLENYTKLTRRFFEISSNNMRTKNE